MKPTPYSWWSYASHGDPEAPELAIQVIGCSTSDVWVNIFLKQHAPSIRGLEFQITSPRISLELFKKLQRAGKLQSIQLEKIPA